MHIKVFLGAVTALILVALAIPADAGRGGGKGFRAGGGGHKSFGRHFGRQQMHRRAFRSHGGHFGSGHRAYSKTYGHGKSSHHGKSYGNQQGGHGKQHYGGHNKGKKQYGHGHDGHKQQRYGGQRKGRGERHVSHHGQEKDHGHGKHVMTLKHFNKNVNTNNNSVNVNVVAGAGASNSIDFSAIVSSIMNLPVSDPDAENYTYRVRDGDLEVEHDARQCGGCNAEQIADIVVIQLCDRMKGKLEKGAPKSICLIGVDR